MKKQDTGDNFEKIRRVVLDWLTRRDYSQQEIFLKLKSKGYPTQDIEKIITELIQAGLINETRFIENYIDWRRRKGYGPLRISVELQARGLAPDMIAERLQITDNAWFSEARNAWQKHFKGKLPDNFKDRAKQMRFLQYRGYTREHIECVFGREHDEFFTS